MALKEILLLGNPVLNKKSELVNKEEIKLVKEVITDLHDTMMDFRTKYHVGRAIAAPQIGILKQIIYVNIDKPIEIINPRLSNFSTEMITIWDDCMSFPDLLIKLKRHKTCRINYYDLQWNYREMELSGDLSELLQHENDHLNGILATEKAIDKNSFALRSQRHYLTI